MKVILGLGNPGKEYEGTRHNVGWWFLDHLADVWHLSGWKKEGEARTLSGPVGSTQVRLVKPLTYMNLSGQVLATYKRRAFWSAASDLMVVVDEVAIPVGTSRFRARGSAGGHNGLKSVEQHLKTQEYARLRIGIGPNDERRSVGDLSDFVLGNFGKQEGAEVRALFPDLASAMELWLSEGIEPTMNKFNKKA